MGVVSEDLEKPELKKPWRDRLSWLNLHGWVQQASRLPEARWDPESVLRFLLSLLVTMASVGLIALAADGAIKDVPQEIRRMHLSAASTLLLQAAAVLLVSRLLLRNQLAWHEAFGFRNTGLGQTVAWGVAAAVLVFPFNIGLAMTSRLVLQLFSVEPALQPLVETLGGELVPRERLLLGILVVLTAPVVEELLFRGVFYTAIKQAGFPGVALWGTAALFAATHGNLMTFVPLLFFALVLAALYERTGNLLVPMLTHSLFNAANFFMLSVHGIQVRAAP